MQGGGAKGGLDSRTRGSGALATREPAGKSVSGSRRVAPGCEVEAATLGDQTYNKRRGRAAKPGLESTGREKTPAEDPRQPDKGLELTGKQRRRTVRG